MALFISPINYILKVFLLYFCPISFASDGVFQAVGNHDSTSQPPPGVSARVFFENDTYNMVFEPPLQMGYEEGPYRLLFGYPESTDNGVCEWNFDSNRDYSRFWIDRQNEARILIRTRGALVCHDGRIAHSNMPSNSPYSHIAEGDWASETYWVYPDGAHVRTTTIWTGNATNAMPWWGLGGDAYETEETIIVTPDRNGSPEFSSHVQADRAVTMIDMKTGEALDVDFTPYPAQSNFFDNRNGRGIPGDRDANIHVLNMAAVPKHFWMALPIIDGVEPHAEPYYGPSQDMDPVGLGGGVQQQLYPAWGNLGAPSHFFNDDFWKREGNSLKNIWYSGMASGSNAVELSQELVPRVRSWATPPELQLTSPGYLNHGYSKEERAFQLERDGGIYQLGLTISASEIKPLVNPALVIKNWNHSKLPSVFVNGNLFREAKVARESENIVLYLPIRIQSSVQLHFTTDISTVNSNFALLNPKFVVNSEINYWIFTMPSNLAGSRLILTNLKGAQMPSVKVNDSGVVKIYREKVKSGIYVFHIIDYNNRVALGKILLP